MAQVQNRLVHVSKKDFGNCLSRCTRLPNRCCYVDSEGVPIQTAHRALSIVAFARKRGMIESIRKGENGLYRIKGKNGVCSFYSPEEGCGIYEIRPIVCRVYPLVFMNGELQVSTVCPFIQKLEENGATHISFNFSDDHMLAECYGALLKFTEVVGKSGVILPSDSGKIVVARVFPQASDQLPETVWVK